MLPADSPFRRLPADWPRQQVLFTDALRLSAQMAAFSFQRLEGLLKTLMNPAEERGPLGDRAVEGMTYAYGVIDAANRFREVLRVFPGLKHNDVFQLLMRSTAQTKQLRDIVQHLNHELKAIGDMQSAALGTITWLGAPPTNKSPPSAWMLRPGSFYSEQRTVGPIMDLIARLAPGSIAQVSLTTSGLRVDLTDIVHRLKGMLDALAPAVVDHAKDKELLGSDVLIQVALRPAKDRLNDASVETRVANPASGPTTG